MKKLLGMVAVAAALMVGSVANAAQVDIFLTQTSPTGWDLTIDNNGGVGVGAINMLTTGLTVMTLNAANTGIDPSLSVLVADPLEIGVDALNINANAGQAIAGAGLLDVLLASLTGPGPVTGQGSEDLAGAPTVFDTVGGVIADYSITVVPTPPVPEPTTTVLLGLGLAALALVRRSA
jgi:ADP-dependent phosphofructokinase/glucokinase